MNYGVESVLNQARDLGVTSEELLKVILGNNSSYVFEAISRNIEMGRQSGADADFVYNKLMSMVTEEQLDTYIKVLEYVDDIMSEEGLELDMSDVYTFDIEIDFLKTNRELVKQELKSRGVEMVGNVENRVSGGVTLKADVFAQEMPAWDDMYSEKLAQFSDEIYEVMFDKIWNIIPDFDAEEAVDKALAYKDVYKVLHSDDMSGFSKHELDIYFAYKAVTGDVIYYSDDIAAEVMRLYDYLYNDYEEFLENLNDISSSMYCELSIDEYDTFSEMIDKYVDNEMENWFSYSGECGW